MLYLVKRILFDYYIYRARFVRYILIWDLHIAYEDELRVGTPLIKADNQVCSSAGPALWIYDVPDRRLSHANDLPTAHGPLRTHILFYSRYCDVMSW